MFRILALSLAVPTFATNGSATAPPAPPAPEVPVTYCAGFSPANQSKLIRCPSYTKEKFDPKCLPLDIYEYSDIEDDTGPYKLLSNMFAETCGMRMAAFKSSFKSLPQMMSTAVTSIFLNWGIYVVANFVGVAVMNIFEVAPRGRRCWGCFAEGSDGYKTLLGPVYLLLLAFAIFIMGAIMMRFWSEVHEFRTTTIDAHAAEGQWPMELQLDASLIHEKAISCKTIPAAPEECKDALELLFPAYKEVFELMVLMVFTGVDNLLLLSQQLWIGGLSCLVACKCLCCFCCKACPSICGWWCCSFFATQCCICTGLVVVMLYFYAGFVAATLYFGLFVAVFAALLIGLGLAVRYLLFAASCGLCKPLQIPFADQQALLYPFPPGDLSGKGSRSGGFFKKPKVMECDPEKKEQLVAYQQCAAAGDVNANLQAIELAKEIDDDWNEKLGLPHPWVAAGFPAAYAIMTVPMLVMITLVFFLWLQKCQVVFAFSKGVSDLAWFDEVEGPTAVWPFMMQIVKALFVGITNGLHIIFVDVSTAVFTDFRATFDGLWEKAIIGMDPSNLLSADMSKFMPAIMVARFELTVLFVCCRITAFINRLEVEHEVEDSGDEGSSDEEVGHEG